jgi:hypothetical protein
MTTVLSVGQYYVERYYGRGDIGAGRAKRRGSKPAAGTPTVDRSELPS